MLFKPVEAKPDFVVLEKKLLDWWYKAGIVKKYLHKNDSSWKKFSFLDGPITANNPMGVHHAWGRTLKDLYQRYHNMKGEKQRFQNGFDCQGLWVEVEVEKELGFKSKKDIESYGIDKFVKKCKERVLKYSHIQTEQSKRLGYFMDWENSYYTISDENNYMIWFFLAKCWENGWIYKGRDSVPWCPRCGTAISQHEMLTEDYKEVTHKSIFFKVKIRNFQPKAGRPRAEKFKNTYFLVWTTTPWTIPANVALVVDPKIDYVQVEQNGEQLILANDRLALVKEKFKIIKKFKGLELVGTTYQAPFDDLPRVKKSLGNYKHRVVAADKLILPVSSTEGTGIVHAATGAGSEDFALGKKENLPVIEVIDGEANYIDGLGEFSGKNAKLQPELIINYLKNNNYLYRTENFNHRYPACWRCKTELVWRVVNEWYIAMDKKSEIRNPKSENMTLRQRMIEVAKKIKWLPEFGLGRELDWLENMHDWLISKKRYWGLALPIWECNFCGEFKVIGSREELEREAVEGWESFSGHSPHRPWIDKVKIKCQCGKLASRILDVGNPWLDAGIVPFSTLNYRTDKKYWHQWYPADFVTESYPGQFKNWFYSLIAMSTVLTNSPAFKTLLGHGTVLGEDGRPMHKSLGNAIEFNQAADKIGVDVMRWIFVQTEPSNNLLFGYKLAQETRRKLHIPFWNSYKFLVMYWNSNKRKTKVKNLKLLDRWLLQRLDQLTDLVTKNLDKYNHSKAAEAMTDFIKDLSTWYIRRSRDRVSPVNQDPVDKKVCLETLYFSLCQFCRLLAPFNPFIAEEIYKNLTLKESVHLSQWPEGKAKIEKEEGLLEKMDVVRQICEAGHARRKNLGIKVRQPLPKLIIKNLKLKIGQELINLIKDELNVKEVVIEPGEGELKVELDTKITPELKAEGQSRDIIRQIQNERKKKGLTPADKIEVFIPSWPEKFSENIKAKTLAVRLTKSKTFSISKI